MRALTITEPGGPEVLQVVDVPTPQPHDDEILVRVRAAGVNRADLLQRAGHYPAPAGSPQDILGLEFAGEIESVGPRVRNLKRGGRIFGIVGGGAQAEYVITREALALEVPDQLSDVDAGAVPEAYITAHDALFTQAQLRRGERALIHAVASGVGIAALELAKSAGCAVFGTSRTRSKLGRLTALGLDAAIDTTEQRFAEIIADKTGGTGVDVIIDFVGTRYFQDNIAALAPRGRMVVVSTLSGGEAQLSLRTLMAKRLRIMGTMLRGRSFDEKVQATQAFARDVLPLFEKGSLQVVIDRTFSLDEAAEAHRLMERNQTFGKIVLIP